MDPLIDKIFRLAITPFLKFLFALAAIIFIFGVVEFILNADNEDKRAQGKKHIVWGIIGLFIMFSVWGIIEIIMNFTKAL